MKSYTVKEIASLLSVNEETVRRWIRSKELKARQISRKSGNVISEEQLNAFLATHPNYSRKEEGIVSYSGDETVSVNVRIAELKAQMESHKALLKEKKKEVKNIESVLKEEEKLLEKWKKEKKKGKKKNG